MTSQKSSPAKAAGIISKPGNPEVPRIVPGLVAWLREHGYHVVADRETEPHVSGAEIITREQFAGRKLGFVTVLGGDGTLLAAARAVAKSEIPVLGVNLGSLGFLTEVPLEEIYGVLANIDAGDCQVELRSMVHCEVFRKDALVARYDALNDIVVGKGTISRLNHCDVYVDEVFVSAYKADSLIVSTPTGSTAYSLAAGGPIVMPTVEAFVITPVSAHSLTHRPVVVPAISEIKLIVNTGADQAYLSVDGQVGMPMYDGDQVRCRKSEYTVRLFQFGSFFDVLRTKFKWGQR